MHNKFVLSLFFSLIFISFSFTESVFAQSDEYLGEDRILHNVAQEYDSKGFGFDILYTLEGVLEPEVQIEPDSNSITFFYDSQGIEEDVLIIELPQLLIDTPGAVFIDGVQEPRAIVNSQGAFTTMYIPLFIEDKEITIIGTKVIPEFGSIAILILVMSIVSIIILTSKKVSNFTLR
jgi:predicted secreted protein with PEFG-CTERM motif